MNPLPLAVVVVSSAFVLAASRPPAAPPERAAPKHKDAERLRGEWRCASAVVNGKPLPETTVKKLKLTLTADRYKTESGDEVLFDSTYTLDDEPSPAHIDMVGTEGDAAGKV